MEFDFTQMKRTLKKVLESICSSAMIFEKEIISTSKHSYQVQVLMKNEIEFDLEPE